MTESRDLETELIRRAWTDTSYARLLRADPIAALAELRVTVPDGVGLDVRIQRPDTLYYMIPPMTSDADEHAITNQMDLWRSGDLFIWLMPETAKVALLDMRQQYRQVVPRE